MADGAVGAQPLGETRAGHQASKELPAPLRWLVRSRRGRFAALAGIAGISWASALAWHFYGRPLLSPDMTWLFGATLAIPVTLLLLLLLDPDDNMAKGPGVALPVLTLAMLGALAALVAADRILGARILFDVKDARIVPKPGPVIVYFAFVAAAFVPRIWSAALFAIFKSDDIRRREEGAARKRASGDFAAQATGEELERRRAQQDDAEALGAVFATATVIGVCGLAYLAGIRSDPRTPPVENGLGVWLSAGVIGLFAVVIFLKWIAESPPVQACSKMVRGFSRRMSWLASFYNAIDTLLVRIGAYIAGTEHHLTRTRYGILAGTLLSLTVAAWYLPPPLGLIPAAVGFILSLSVSRLWAWVEEDRNLASITRFNPDAPRRVGFREDFRDETLLGFTFVLLLIPIALMQADASKLFGQELFSGSDKGKLNEWLGYFGFELAKALPVVDWADIYNLVPGKSLLRTNGALGMHAVFAARATVDLVLISSLLQALTISTRNRQQKALFAAGHIDRFDELVEKEELARVLARPQSRRFKEGVVDFRRYSRDRLKELYHGSDNGQLQRFIQEIFQQAQWPLDPAISTLVRLSQSHRSEAELYTTFEAVKTEHAKGAKIELGDLIEILTNLRDQYGLKDFKVQMLDFASKIGSPADIAAMAEIVIFGPLRDGFQYTRKHAAKVLADTIPRIADASVLSDLLNQTLTAGTKAFGALQAVPAMLASELRKRLAELQLKPPAPQNKP